MIQLLLLLFLFLFLLLWCLWGGKGYNDLTHIILSPYSIASQTPLRDWGCFRNRGIFSAEKRRP